MYNNTMISFNMLEVARIAGVKRFFYASSACIYPEYKQLDVEVEGGGLKEGDAWPAQPQDAYGECSLLSSETLFSLALFRFLISLIRRGKEGGRKEEGGGRGRRRGRRRKRREGKKNSLSSEKKT